MDDMGKAILWITGLSLGVMLVMALVVIVCLHIAVKAVEDPSDDEADALRAVERGEG